MIAICVLGATHAAAQEAAGHAYVGGGLLAARQDGVNGVSSQTYVTAPGGTTVGWSVTAGVFLARFVSVEGEFATTGTMRAREPSRYGMTFNEERRDRFFWGAVRFHVPLAASADLEPLAGFGLVSTLTTSQTEYAGFPERIGPAYAGPVITDTVPVRPVLALGCAARIGGAHLAFVPSFRVLRAGAYPDWPTYYPGGVSQMTISVGAVLRATF